MVADGERLYRNSTGNPGMATGGSGDVLTGVVAALVGHGAVRGSTPRHSGRSFTAGRATWPREVLGQTALTATDLLDYLPLAFRELEIALVTHEAPSVPKLFCPSCMKPVPVPDDFAGREVTCPSCNKVFDAPAKYNANRHRRTEPTSDSGASQDVARSDSRTAGPSGTAHTGAPPPGLVPPCRP